MTTRDPSPGPDPQAPDGSGVPPLPAPDAEHQALLDQRDQIRSTVTDVEHTRARASWVGVIVGTIVLVFLLIFILQNLESQQISLIFWDVNFPVGISLLIAAIAGALIVALVGGLRMFQMSRALKKAKRIGPDA
ncbi:MULTISPECIES: lipopolysaccharide assembly LapA domain-containing protein [unclassified Gordonia (in: high G+C Gram-positive bacteria)]|uniref:LapA family protein n=1 Tax=unclassified Gordonia (in: high G+C Gram-positive bacteria) TaxID=2657482 RepID=UPI001F11178D|nr:lipopolysaccharide assembly protein LapA domain-containing protein [Gordonia sp. ABSL49_1]MCH5642384.1 lipopolysaccharide assembly protein LapA domain-containing protein [Gordonia sp. ABSL49_1]